MPEILRPPRLLRRLRIVTGFSMGIAGIFGGMGHLSIISVSFELPVRDVILSNLGPQLLAFLIEIFITMLFVKYRWFRWILTLLVAGNLVIVARSLHSLPNVTLQTLWLLIAIGPRLALLFYLFLSKTASGVYSTRPNGV